MTRRIKIFALATLFLASHGSALGGGKASSQSAPFAVAGVHFEQNATDGDVEVVFAVKGGDEGLTKLRVVSPDDRTVIDFSAPIASTLGIRSFSFESPEPRDIESLKSAYPAGGYTFTGSTAAGHIFYGKSTLNHKLPAIASLLLPGPDSRKVGIKDLKIAWRPVKDISGYILEIEQDDLDIKMVAKLPASISMFTVPRSILFPGKVYDLSIGTVNEGGNISFIETSFTTIEKE